MIKQKLCLTRLHRFNIERLATLGSFLSIRPLQEAALEVATVEIAGVPVFLGDSDNRVVLVKIYEALAELPETAVIGRLSYYGRVLSFRRDHVAEYIENGHIPNLVTIARELIRIWYPTQP